MRIGGIISGALGGAAGAVREIGDSNLKLRQAEEMQEKDRANRLADAERDRAWRREDAEREMELKLQRLPELARVTAEAETEAEGIRLGAQNKRREEITRGVIGRELSGSVIGDESTWTPEQEEVRQRGLAARGEELRSDPKVRQEIGLQMGELTEKDIMTDDRNRDIAQLRAEVANAKNEQQREIAQARLDQALALLNMKISAGAYEPRGGSGGGGGSNERDINTALNNLSLAEDRVRRQFRQPTTNEKFNPREAEKYQAELNKFVEGHPTVTAARQRYESMLGGGAPTVGGSANPGDNPKAPPKVPKLPAGAVKVGTSGGKAVYKTPDGKLFIED